VTRLRKTAFFFGGKRSLKVTKKAPFDTFSTVFLPVSLSTNITGLVQPAAVEKDGENKEICHVPLPGLEKGMNLC
jgi:hypothetical protein